MALCVLAAAWKKAAGRKAAGEEGSDASAFVDGLLGVVVDHGLRPESADEARLVCDRVRGMGVECEIARCEWPDGRPKQGHVQEAAREVRYQKLLDICIKQQIGVLLIAHHSDDQAELFVLRLSRNSGILGLAGTAFVSQLFAPNVKYDGENFRRYGVLLVRPMLDFSKDDMYKVSLNLNIYGIRMCYQWMPNLKENVADFFFYADILSGFLILEIGHLSYFLFNCISYKHSTISQLEQTMVIFLCGFILFYDKSFLVDNFEDYHQWLLLSVCLRRIFLCCSNLIASHFLQICQGSNQSWVEDPTNNSMMYARNRIRASLRNLSAEGLQLYLKLPCLIHFCGAFISFPQSIR